MRVVPLSVLLMLSVLGGGAQRHPILAAAPLPPPPPATNQQTLVEAPPLATLPEPPLPALKPGIELTLVESEALADQASQKAPVETQPMTSQKAMNWTAGQAANLAVTGMDAPPLTDADHLVGLSKSDVTKLFGPPAESKERPPSQIWTYHSAVCDVTLFFYPEVNGWAFRALTYQIDERSGSDVTHHACLISLVKPPVN